MDAICRKIGVFLVLVLSFPVGAADSCKVVDQADRQMVENINQRYDDFFHRQREMDSENQKREATASEIKAYRQARQAELEKARIDYIKNRRPRADDEADYQKWLAEEKQRKEENDHARTRYLARKTMEECIRRRGRTIPELREYDLQDY